MLAAAQMGRRSGRERRSSFRTGRSGGACGGKVRRRARESGGGSGRRPEHGDCRCSDVGRHRRRAEGFDGRPRGSARAAGASDDSGRIARAARLTVKAGAAEAEDLPKLRAAASSAGWAGSSALVIGRESLRPLPAIDVVRSRRRNPDGTDAATLLTKEKIPAVMYEDGKVVMSPGLISSGDRLLMRRIPVAATGLAQSGNNRRFLLFGLLPGPFVLDPPGNARSDTPILVAGLRITSSGLVVDMGGKGAPGLDFRLPNLFPSGFFVGHTGANGGYDLKLTFGVPAASPEGNAEHYWTAQLMPWSEHLTVPLLRSRLSNGERALGVYTMRLSNHVGLDRNLENPDDPAASVRDDVNHYLVLCGLRAYGILRQLREFGQLRKHNPRAGGPFPFMRTTTRSRTRRE